MFAYIIGTLSYKHNNYIILETNEIGYKIFTSISTIASLELKQEKLKVYTHLYVREDTFSLYGFLTQEELSLFELLIGVSGIGPKAAVSLLSAITPSEFGFAIITEDAKILTRAQGIGIKIAKRMILELKDKIKNEQVIGYEQNTTYIEGNKNDKTVIKEAISALMVLGYTFDEANKAATSEFSEEADLQTVIKRALKLLAR